MEEMRQVPDGRETVWGSNHIGGALVLRSSLLPHGLLQATGSMVGEELGYEDVDEFEDAINGKWKEFLELLPNVEMKFVENVTGTIPHLQDPLHLPPHWHPCNGVLL